jgi:hypothetical protein
MSDRDTCPYCGANLFTVGFFEREGHLEACGRKHRIEKEKVKMDEFLKNTHDVRAKWHNWNDNIDQSSAAEQLVKMSLSDFIEMAVLTIASVVDGKVEGLAYSPNTFLKKVENQYLAGAEGVIMYCQLGERETRIPSNFPDDLNLRFMCLSDVLAGDFGVLTASRHTGTDPAESPATTIYWKRPVSQADGELLQWRQACLSQGFTSRALSKSYADMTLQTFCLTGKCS